MQTSIRKKTRSLISARILKERLTSVENKTPWEKIRGTRQMTRPCALDYIDYICEDFHEIHGDRTMNDDKAIVGGIGHIDGQPCNRDRTGKGFQHDRVYGA